MKRKEDGDGEVLNEKKNSDSGQDKGIERERKVRKVGER